MFLDLCSVWECKYLYGPPSVLENTSRGFPVLVWFSLILKMMFTLMGRKQLVVVNKWKKGLIFCYGKKLVDVTIRLHLFSYNWFVRCRFFSSLCCSGLRAKRGDIYWIMTCLNTFHNCLPCLSAHMRVFVTSHGGHFRMCGIRRVCIVVVKHVCFFFLFKPTTNPLFCSQQGRRALVCQSNKTPCSEEVHWTLSTKCESIKANTN